MKYIDYLSELYPSYRWNWHHILIAQEIDKWLNTPNGKLMVLAPPRSGKSTLSSITLPAFIQEFYPDSGGISFPKNKITCATYSWSLAEERKRDLMRIQSQRNLPYRNETFCGIGSITGSGAHIGIIDETESNPGRTSQEYQSKVIDWYCSTFVTRFFAGHNKQFVICSASPGCLATHILKWAKQSGDIWTVVRIKAMQEPAVTTSDALEVPYWDCPMNNIAPAAKVAMGELNWRTLMQQELL